MQGGKREGDCVAASYDAQRLRQEGRMKLSRVCVGCMAVRQRLRGCF